MIDYKKNIEWYGYFSSTSVYGNHDGAWVEETTKLNPTSLRGLRRKQAEKDHIYLYKIIKFQFIFLDYLVFMDQEDL